MKEQTHQDASAESAYRATGSPFYSCVRIKFSDGYNAMYGQKDPFCHLVAMRGKHGYAEGSSNAEDVGRHSPSLPSWRWTQNRVESVHEDRMLAGCGRMIARPVKRLRRHGLLRKPVDIATDFHDVCRYDKDPDIK